MEYKRGLLIILLAISLCVSNLNAEAKPKEDVANNQVVVELGFLPSGVKPGNMPIDLNKSLLTKLLPELKNPRLMTLKDLDEKLDEPRLFMDNGYTFVLRDDFNRDGIADIAFVGKYDNPDQPYKNSFIATVSIKGKQVIREYFSKVFRDRISLLRAIEYKPKIDAIGMSFNLVSDDCAYLFWTGKKWQVDACRSDFSNE